VVPPDVSCLVVLITVPGREEAERIAEVLVQERWAACVNILPSVTSLFWWEGRMDREEELLLVVKTRRDLFPSLASRVKQLHPYTVPEIIGLPIVEGWGDYLQWVVESTIPRGG